MVHLFIVYFPDENDVGLTDLPDHAVERNNGAVAYAQDIGAGAYTGEAGEDQKSGCQDERS
jgi:hypothetical protein